MREVIYVAQIDRHCEGKSEPVFATKIEAEILAFKKGAYLTYGNSIYCSLIDINTGSIEEYTNE